MGYCCFISLSLSLALVKKKLYSIKRRGSTKYKQTIESEKAKWRNILGIHIKWKITSTVILSTPWDQIVVHLSRSRIPDHRIFCILILYVNWHIELPKSYYSADIWGWWSWFWLFWLFVVSHNCFRSIAHPQICSN